MSGEPFHGIFPYLVSPVDDTTGRIREDALRRLVSYLIDCGVHGLSPLGSTGEFAYLTLDQRKEIVRVVVDEAAGRVPVTPGVAAFATADAIQQARTFLELGADGLVLILQTFFPLSRPAIESYFRTVAESVSCPVILYTNPGFQTADLNPEMVESLSHVSNIRYLKDASDNTGRILTTVNCLGDRMRVFSASAHVPLLVFQVGGVGWMAGPACVLPKECVRLYELTKARRWDDALALQRPLWRINEVFQKYSLAGCIKAALEIQGFPVGGPVPPQEPLTQHLTFPGNHAQIEIHGRQR
ncbi:MAG: dihydrodipicolinate synthase family protein [Chloroflexi bacterium]|nr:dihydrodipicolinate synthase family protein [Chloroflexota bacterium]